MSMVPTRKEVMRSYTAWAASDVEPGSRDLYVYCEELLPFIKGELKAIEIENEIKMKTEDDEYESKLKTTNVILAEYKDDLTHNLSVPLVRKGEQVILYNYADTDKFYWKCAARNDNARRLDTQRMGVSGTREYAPELTEENTYYSEIDTRINKRIRFSTSKEDGESFRYIFELNAGTNTITLSDDDGNILHFDSTVPRICMKNRDNSLIDLNGKNITIACDGVLSLMSKKDEMYIYSKKKMLQVTDDAYELSFRKGMTSRGNGSTMTMYVSHLGIWDDSASAPPKAEPMTEEATDEEMEDFLHSIGGRNGTWRG